jgi:hypothetical protein
MMSDTTVAPEGSAPAPVHEVVVTEAPTSAPTPIGSQAPDKSPAELRREAIQKAFDRANSPPVKPERPKEKVEAKPAEAKPGHNQPPKDDKKDEPLDLKTRPADQPRGERGQFAPREQAQQQAPREQQQQRPAKQLPEGAPYRDPPPRISERARIDWADTPETVRGDFHRMQQEFSGAYQRYREDNETMETIRPFHDLAKQQGTTLQRALSSYVSMEHKLRADPLAGLDVIVSNLNLKTPDGRKATLRDVAYTVLSQSPDQLKAIQTQNAQAASHQQIGALHQEIAGLKQTLQQMHTQQQFTYTRSAVDQFAETHPRFDELGDVIEAELKSGYDLETAYRRAELLRPTTHAAQTRTTPAQTRPADRSISGSPDVAPSNGASRRSEKKVSRREALQSAISRVQGGL